MTRKGRIIPAFLAWMILLSACSRTSYIDMQEDEDRLFNPNLLERTVAFELDANLALEWPDCVVLDTRANADLEDQAGLIRTATDALVARLSRKFALLKIHVSESENADSLESILDGCGYLMSAEITRMGEVSTLIWSDKRFGIEMRLERVEDGLTVWHARHVASRSAGGVPLSIVGAATTIFKTIDFIGDDDIMPSLIDDAVRRVLATLPGRPTE